MTDRCQIINQILDSDMYVDFRLWFIFLLINLKSSDNSLLSRFKSPNEYIPSDAGKLLLPEEIDDALYEELLLEVPELRGQFRSNSMAATDYAVLPYIKIHNSTYETTQEDEDFDMETDDQEVYPTQVAYESETQLLGYNSTRTHRMPFLKHQPPMTESYTSDHTLRLNGTLIRDGRRRGSWPARYRNARRVATCYWCGMLHRDKLPEGSICYDAFESPDWRARTMARFFRSRCFKASFQGMHIDQYKLNKHIWYWWDRGLVRARYGPFYGGCFKRFTDVGKIYTQRGCRRNFPAYTTPNFASHR